MAELPLDLVISVLSRLPSNSIAASARLICRTIYSHFAAPEYRTIRISDSIPPHAFVWRFGRSTLGDSSPANSDISTTCGSLRQLPFIFKLKLLAYTAGSGCIENLQVLFAAAGGRWWYTWPIADPDACAAAARGGHMHVIRWMMERGYPLHAETTASAVVQHCELADARWLLAQPPFARHQPSAALLCAAAASTTPDARAKLEWLLDELPGCPLHEGAVAEAARRGDTDTADWLLARGCPADPPSTLCAAAAGGASHGIGWALECWEAASSPASLRAAAEAAAGAGRAEALRVLLPAAFEASSSGTEAGSDDGRDVQVPAAGLFVAWGDREEADGAAREAAPLLRGAGGAGGREGDLVGDIRRALGLGHAPGDGGALLEVPARRPSARESLLHACLRAACSCGHLEVVQALVEGFGAAPYVTLMQDLAGSGSVEAARWLWRRAGGARVRGAAAGSEHAGYWRARALEAAARAGDVRMLDFLTDEVGLTWNASAPNMEAAALECLKARGGEAALPLLAWLRRRGSALRDLGLKPLRHGPPRLLDWLLEARAWHREQLAARYDDAMEEAAGGGCEAVVAWLVDLQGGSGAGGTKAAPRSPADSLAAGRAYLAAARNGDLDTLRCLRRLGVPCGEGAVREAVGHLPLRALRWLVEVGGAPVGRHAVAAAAGSRRADVVEWLRQRGGEEGRPAEECTGEGDTLTAGLIARAEGYVQPRGRLALGRRAGTAAWLWEAWAGMWCCGGRSRGAGMDDDTEWLGSPR